MCVCEELLPYFFEKENKTWNTIKFVSSLF